jgi:hypothetical protein
VASAARRKLMAFTTSTNSTMSLSNSIYCVKFGSMKSILPPLSHVDIQRR